LKRLHEATLKKLERYHWPGNVRELQHAIESSVIMSDSAALKPTDFLFPSRDIREESLSIEDYNLEEIEKIAVRKAIKKHGGNISKAAKELGLTRSSLYRRMERYGI
jgi:transcriptional regulator of acetoin/glycerol metabolism